MKNGVIQTSKPDAEGHGIGLQNTKNIVEKYHGDISVKRSETMLGAKFIVTLPKGDE